MLAEIADTIKRLEDLRDGIIDGELLHPGDAISNRGLIIQAQKQIGL